MKIYEWITQNKGTLFKFEKGRIERSVQTQKPAMSIHGRSVDASIAKYQVFIKLTSSLTSNAILIETHCGCEDYQQRYYEGGDHVQPCKHIIRVMQEVSVEELDMAAVNHAPVALLPDFQSEEEEVGSGGRTSTFNERVSGAIERAVNALANKVAEVLAAGRVPFLVGPTGCGKTSAVSKAALMLGTRFYETAGADSWTDSDLVGVMMPNGKSMPGPIGNAMMHAQLTGEKVLIFLDEFLRFSPRAQESMMRVLLPKSAEIAQAMGIDHNGPIRVTSAPFWGETWAPAELCHIVLAANPWGNIPDSALLRRVEPIQVEFSNDVLNLFTGKAHEAILTSWKGTADGSLPLPLEYSELARATSDGDTSFLSRYLARMQVIDPAAASGFNTLLNNTKA